MPPPENAPIGNDITIHDTDLMTQPWKMFFVRWARSFAAAIQTAVIAGGAAGDLTVTGVNVGDQLVSVTRYIGAGVAVTDISNLTSEFSITAPDTINNTGGTNTTGSKLLVTWVDLT